MQISLQSLLELASEGDKLANEAVRVIFEASIQGMHASAYMSFPGKRNNHSIFPALAYSKN